ncbi:MAG: OmpA/MotB domain protein [Actinomycetia bacterium]|nr:OmpA/MotB domain protein [Actinomycetes bacterium]
MSQRVRRRDHEEEAHDNEERWLLTYADMITLLMVLFIVLFSIGQLDLKKFQQLSSGLAQSFGTAQNVALTGGTGVLDGGDSPLDSQTATEILQAQQQAAADAQRQLQETAEKVKEALVGQGLGDKVTFRFEDRGLVLQIVTDDVLFDLGKADLRPEGRAVLDGLVPALKDVPNKLSVEGHTDNRPISGFPFASNWELSTYRATSVLRYLVEQRGLDAKRIAAAGYGEEQPLVPNDTLEHQAKNRRVEIVVLAPTQVVRTPSSTTPTTSKASTGG